MRLVGNFCKVPPSHREFLCAFFGMEGGSEWMDEILIDDK